MALEKNLMKSLKNLIDLLGMERSALMSNDVDQISMLIDKKNEQINALSVYKGLDIENSREAMDLIKEIDSMQELNLLLTQQALSYQNAILESISKNLNNFSNTYSAKGTYNNSNNISIIDQSV